MNNKPLPWLWLEGSEGELIGHAACGCRLIRDYDCSGDPAFDMCPMHEAAPEMLTALKDVGRSLPALSELPKAGASHTCIDLPASLVRKIIRIVNRIRG